jgi:hypothetical protein
VSYRLNDDRIRALDAIGFDWNLSAGDLIKANSASTSEALAAQFQAATTATTNNVRTSPVVAAPGSSSGTDGVAAAAATLAPIQQLMSNARQAGVGVQPSMTTDMASSFIATSTEIMDKIEGVGVHPPDDVPLLPLMNSSVTAGVPPAHLATLSSDPRTHCKRKSEDSEPAEKKQDAKRYHNTMDKPPTNIIEDIPPMTTTSAVGLSDDKLLDRMRNEYRKMELLHAEHTRKMQLLQDMELYEIQRSRPGQQSEALPLPPSAKQQHSVRSSASGSISSSQSSHQEWDIQAEYLKMQAFLIQRNQLAEKLSSQHLLDASSSSSSDERRGMAALRQKDQHQQPHYYMQNTSSSIRNSNTFNRQYSSNNLHMAKFT